MQCSSKKAQGKKSNKDTKRINPLSFVKKCIIHAHNTIIRRIIRELHIKQIVLFLSELIFVLSSLDIVSPQPFEYILIMHLKNPEFQIINQQSSYFAANSTTLCITVAKAGNLTCFTGSPSNTIGILTGALPSPQPMYGICFTSHEGMGEVPA